MNLFKCFNSQCQETFINEDKIQLAELVYYNESESIQKQKSMQEEQDQKIALQYQEEEKKKESLFIKTYDCQICLGNFELSALKTLNCDHRMCSTCLTELIKSYINEGKYKEDDLICPFVENSKLCGWPLEKGIEGNSDYGIIRWAIDEQYWDKLCNYRMNQLPGFMYDFQFIDDAQIHPVVDGLKCLNKRLLQIVLLAKHIFVHCALNNRIKEIAKIMLFKRQEKQQEVQEWTLENAHIVDFSLQKIKDVSMQYVSNAKKIELFVANKKEMQPILSHGNHYHAQGCWCGDNYQGEDKIEKNCEECNALGKICPRPGQINPELIEFNKLAEEERNKRDVAK